ncbi:carboxylesterase/lipase family protein [Pantoea stewartii]|uniref:carboxylesterase/lipase family protein n=1 Tax=Pantoea stewartii TaxID=66269 RepID=UPI00197EF860|nr:carboxylesterase family protein [Pantoea stewartii]
MKNDGLKIALTDGELQGTLDDGIFVFKGIPYAAPPVGAYRWRAPQPVKPWHGVRNAQHFSAASWQNRDYCLAIGGGDPGVFSEDCLYLNVWTPELQPEVPLPVMVWLHGGGFTIGSGGLAPYSGKPLASRGAVVVTLNYRLGHLGFFAHPALEKEQADTGHINNFALLDQIAALRWVQQHIAAFGGNASNVTLFGESSGARSVLSLCCSPLSRGLFHKGIVQSAYSLPDVTRDAAREKGVMVATALGLPADASMAQLRELPADAFWPLDSSLGLGPVAIAGDTVLPEPVLKTLMAGKQHRLPLMAGSNSDEASVLVWFGVEAAAVVGQLRRNNHFHYRLLRWIYRTGDDALLGRAVARDMTFSIVPWLIMRAQEKVGMPGWRYWFDYVSERSHDLYPHGTWHGNEIPYVMNTLAMMPPADDDRTFTAADHAFSQQVCDYWFRFARDVTPHTTMIEGKQRWPAWRKKHDVTMSLGWQGQAALKLLPGFMRRRLALFRLMMSRLVRL